jgi:hypothetical protein
MAVAAAPRTITAEEHALAQTLDALRQHIFNGVIWPDFTRLPSVEAPALRFEPLNVGEVLTLGQRTSAIVDSDVWLRFVEQFGFVSDRIALLEAMTVAQNLAIPFSLEIDPISPDVLSRVHALAAEVGIAPSGLSGLTGEASTSLRAKVRLARALALDPRVLVLEHPTASLALDEAKPDLIFSSMLFADLPIFLKQGHAAGLFEQSKLVLPTATAQLRELNKEYIPEGNILAYNTMYFAHPQASQLQKDFVREYIDRNKGEVPHWVADRAYFNVAAYKAGVEKAMKTTGRWPKIEEIADSILGLEVESLGGKARYREDKIAEQMFYQGPTTNKNEYRFPTLAVVEGFSARDLQKPVGADFWEWIKTAKMPV